MNGNEKVCVVRKQYVSHYEQSPREQWLKAWRAARKFGPFIQTSAEAEVYGAMFLRAWQCLLYRQYFSGDV
ncbi:hypothetical protein [Halothiobacillus neapolitanus]|jgi:hypothetical protein|uniref:Uncharacterized protein n=1 Tax=Halothiobacillus neapolitanus (strain ATCC 23641 / DSM 15147 / CIP 104769 / NCIMB 8539 / c2) TaxID=555778 RepID=D0L194_HALNC|nr:hypothetical protein [Halothiobacillus neapolitanus]ACX96467.1 hypothetical protein Hneap_1641 [Halothiobacillus neapolitanus c2]TDN66784.1 hypothetical protein C8D83_1011123 [Halothiobacillus neapolitanus]